MGEFDLAIGGHASELAEIKRELDQARAAQERISRILVVESDDDPLLEKRYRETRQRVGEIESRLKLIESESGSVARRAIEAQLKADPALALGNIFDVDLPPERLRSTLVHVLPEIVFQGKPWGRYTSVFKLRFAMGKVLAQIAGAPVIDSEALESHFKLMYHPTRKGEKEAGWTVEEI